jgi:predicted acetyltransferase
MSEVEVRIAIAAERPALANLLQLYIHDFSEFWADRPDGEIGEDGRFAAPPLDAYWHDPDHVPLLIRKAGRLAGFALLDRAAHAGGAPDRNMAEFFVARKHRRAGVGAEAARAIFSRYPGAWQVAVARRNLPALAFWRRTIAAHPLARAVEMLDIADDHWNGPVFRFRIVEP